MTQDPLKYIPMEKWPDIQKAFLTDFPRSIPGYNFLETQIRWKEKGYGYGFQVYCPFGDVKNGFVAVNEKAASYQIIIQYPKDDTKVLEDAMKTTKIINWDKKIILPCMSFHVIDCVKTVIKDKNVELGLMPCDVFLLERDSHLFEDVSLPPGCTFDLLSPEHIELINSKWPYRYPTSSWYLKLLINMKSGYGLYKDGELTAWIFIDEVGKFVHLYTLEDHRRKGYAELILKLASNKILRQKRDVLAFCIKGNINAYKLYEKVGFQKSIDVAWGYLNKKSN